MVLNERKTLKLCKNDFFGPLYKWPPKKNLHNLYFNAFKTIFGLKKKAFECFTLFPFDRGTVVARELSYIILSVIGPLELKKCYIC